MRTDYMYDARYYELKESTVIDHFNFKKLPEKRERSPYWCFCYSYTDPATGKQSHSKISSRTGNYKEALQRRKQLMEEAYDKHLRGKRKGPSKDQSLQAFFDDYLKISRHRVRESTLVGYSRYIERFLKSTDSHLPLGMVTTPMMREWITGLGSKYSQLHGYKNLKAAFQWAVDEGKIDRNPVTAKLRPSIKDITPFTLRTKDFYAFYLEMPEGTYMERLLKYATLLAFCTGLRSGEVRNLQLTDIDVDTGQLQVLNQDGFETKSGRERSLMLPTPACEALQLQLKNKLEHDSILVTGSDYIFCNTVGNVKSIHDFSKEFRKTVQALRPNWRRVTFHTLRHSFGQNAYNTGLSLQDIAKALGHSNPLVTARFYARLDAYSASPKLQEYIQSLDFTSRPSNHL